MTTAVFARHRGPYRLQVCRERPTTGKRYPATVIALPGVVSAEDIEADALALLTDPRDTITAVYVYSETEQLHVITYNRAWAAQHAAAVA